MITDGKRDIQQDSGEPYQCEAEISVCGAEQML